MVSTPDSDSGVLSSNLSTAFFLYWVLLGLFNSRRIFVTVQKADLDEQA